LIKLIEGGVWNVLIEEGIREEWGLLLGVEVRISSLGL
jgi:hypothetical protein